MGIERARGAVPLPTGNHLGTRVQATASAKATEITVASAQLDNMGRVIPMWTPPGDDRTENLAVMLELGDWRRKPRGSGLESHPVPALTTDVVKPGRENTVLEAYASTVTGTLMALCLARQ